MKRIYPLPLAIAGVIVALFVHVAGARANSVPMVGLDDSGNEVTFETSDSEYSDRLTSILSSVDGSVRESMRSASDSPGHWLIRSFSVGIGLGVEVGIGPIIKVKASPRIRMIYSNSQDPVIP